MAKKKQDTLVLFPDILTATRRLSNEQFGVLMRAIFAYRFDGANEEMDDPMVDIAFDFVKTQLDRYKQICQIRSENGKKAKRSKDETAQSFTAESSKEKQTETDASKQKQTQANVSKEKQTAAHTHTHNHNHTHTQNHNHSHNHNPIELAAQPPTPFLFSTECFYNTS